MTQIKIKSPSWKDVYKYWKKHKVPYITFKEFDYEKDNHVCPWYSKVKKEPQYYRAIPIQNTARGLFHLSNESDELKALFMITSFVFENELCLLIPTLKEAQSQLDVTVDGFWHTNSKHTLPYTDNDLSLDNYIDEKTRHLDWKKLIELAANKWIRIENQLQVIQLPRYYPFKSKVYKGYLKELDKKRNEYLYQQYLNLQILFETSIPEKKEPLVIKENSILNKLKTLFGQKSSPN